MTQQNTQVRAGNTEEPEYVDQSQWIPRGQEVIPQQILLNKWAKMDGKMCVVVDKHPVDRLYASRLIDGSHHHTAFRLIQLARMGTSKQGYATMKLFSPTPGFDHSDYCPISIFIRVTRGLKPVYAKWIRVICGLEDCNYKNLAANVQDLKTALDQVSDKLEAYDEALKAAADYVGDVVENLD